MWSYDADLYNVLAWIDIFYFILIIYALFFYLFAKESDIDQSGHFHNFSIWLHVFFMRFFFSFYGNNLSNYVLMTKYAVICFVVMCSIERKSSFLKKNDIYEVRIFNFFRMTSKWVSKSVLLFVFWLLFIFLKFYVLFNVFRVLLKKTQVQGPTGKYWNVVWCWHLTMGFG